MVASIGSGLYARWAREMRQGQVFHPGERVGVAVSGGPDSSLLLAFMEQLAPQAGLFLAVIHFNHHLRGDQSDADEEFVRQRAGGLGLDFYASGAPVREVAREARRNLEATARELRYRFFLSLIHHGKLDKVATAHTANDQAETVLLRLIRGSGTRGLGGIYPSVEGKVVRPFLSLTRAEIEAEVARRKLECRLDPSNRDPQRTRNRIRTDLLPMLEREFNPAMVMSLKEFADRARDDESYLEQQALERARPWRIHADAEERIPVRSFGELPHAVARRVLRQMITALRGHLRGILSQHIETLRWLACAAGSGKRVSLPGGLVARREFEWLIIERTGLAPAAGSFSFPVIIPGEVKIPQLGLKFCFKMAENNIELAEPRKAYNSQEGVARLDRERLSDSLTLRNWRPGDRFHLPGRRKSMKLKELFQRQRVPDSARWLWPVLESDGDLVWVWRFPPATRAAVSPSTRHMVIVSEQAWSSGSSNSPQS